MNQIDLVSQNPVMEQTGHMGTKDLVSIVLRRRWIILGIFLPIFLVAFLATLHSTSTVTASTRVILETNQPESPDFYSGRVDYNVLMSTASQVVISIPVAELAAEALMDSLPVLVKEIPEFNAIKSSSDFTELILQSEDCNQVGETNILEISVTHPNPHFALMAVKAITSAYQEYNIQMQRNEPAVQYYTDQINHVMVEIDSLNSRRAQILEEYGLIAFDRSAQSNTAQIVEIEREFFKARAYRQSLETMLEGIKTNVDREPTFYPQSQDFSSQELFALKRMIDEEGTALTKLQQQYTDNSEWVRRQEAVVDELKKKFIIARDNLVQHYEVQLDAARSRERAIKESIDQQKNQASKYPEAQRQLSRVDVNIETQMDLLELLQTKRGEVRVKAASDHRVSNIVPLNEPSISRFVGSSKKVIYLFLASLFGLALGLIAALFADNQDHRLYTKFEVQEYLEIPVLGSISRTRE